jgi:hypothetical protein
MAQLIAPSLDFIPFVLGWVGIPPLRFFCWEVWVVLKSLDGTSVVMQGLNTSQKLEDLMVPTPFLLISGRPGF